jgi:threonine dehydrogenase-like Zn-dependent dehydrogenase
MPRFIGTFGQHGGPFTPGDAPLHEAVGDVIESTSSRLPVGIKVVGTLDPSAGLAEVVTVDEDRLIEVPKGLDDVEAIIIQPISTVIRAVTQQFPDVTGRSTAIIGAGPTGLAFCHVLRHMRVGPITAIDPIARPEALDFGADEILTMTSSEWAAALAESSRRELIVEAVGHQQRTIADAIEAAADGAYVFGFGAPDDVDYVFPYLTVYLRDLTVASGRTIGNWPEILQRGAEYVVSHRRDFASYVSHVVPVEEAQRAYELYARPQEGRLKIVIATAN